ncbi:MAG: adenylate/guanylate cyclase domain-containing protein [Bdellovibrionota bacterium]
MLNNEDLLKVNESLLRGVVSRAGILSGIFCVAFTIYGFSSYEFITTFHPELTLLNNVWPRFIFNTIPLGLFWYYFRNYQDNVKLKVIMWTFGLPLILVSACFIHVWPIIYSGQSEIILYVHSANAFIITMCFLTVSPPPKYLYFQGLTLTTIFVAPLAWMLYKNNSFILLKTVLSDLGIAFVASIIIALQIYKLRLKIATFDIKVKRSAAPFLGDRLTKALYEQNEDLLKERKVDAIIVMVDIRNYSEFSNKNSEQLVKDFMNEYHANVSKIFNDKGGYLHKTSGDGHMVSFGVMDESPDLKDLPGYDTEGLAAEIKLGRARFTNALAAMATLAYQFDTLKQKYDVTENMALGIGVAEGDVTVSVHGDEHRKELDISGRTIILSSRLETYSKTIKSKIAPTQSVVVLQSTLSRHFEDNHRMFKKWDTLELDLKVRNFPEIDHVYYHVFFNKYEKRESILKLRAS